VNVNCYCTNFLANDENAFSFTGGLFAYRFCATVIEYAVSSYGFLFCLDLLFDILIRHALLPLSRRFLMQLALLSVSNISRNVHSQNGPCDKEHTVLGDLNLDPGNFFTLSL